MSSLSKPFLSKRCEVCGEKTGLFAHWNREDLANKAVRELMEGCKKHPGYRYKKKPIAKCKECERLYELYQELRALEQSEKDALAAKMKAQSKANEERRRRDEEYYNSHQ